mmetsp:Transcript_7047/g.43246  ORF Transcript_7047/g.43246 Transcript_7047/m.43246 type:complete len:318 (+) Transcript_7047:1414-2367(+)
MQPIPTTVWGVHFIDEQDIPVLILAKLILCIHKDESPLCRLLLSECKQLEGLLTSVVPIFLVHVPHLHHFLRGDRHIMVFCLGCGRDNVPFQLLVLRHAFWEHVSTVHTFTLFVMSPQGGAGASCHVSAHHELDRKDLAFGHDADIRICHRHQCIGHDVLCLFKPPLCSLVEHLSFEGHVGQHAIERRLSIRRHHHQQVFLASFPSLQGHVRSDHVRVAHFSTMDGSQERHLRLAEHALGVRHLRCTSPPLGAVLVDLRGLRASSKRILSHAHGRCHLGRTGVDVHDGLVLSFTRRVLHRSVADPLSFAPEADSLDL